MKISNSIAPSAFLALFLLPFTAFASDVVIHAGLLFDGIADAQDADEDGDGVDDVEEIHDHQE